MPRRIPASSCAWLLLNALPATSGFVVQQQQHGVHDCPTQLSATNSRRAVLFQSAVAAGSALVSGSMPALAEVADGTSLPQGAAQFQRLLRVKSDLAGVKKRITESASDIDKKEWDNISQFLRQIYSVGDDMKTIAGGIFDPAKKTQALEDAEALKKIAKATDVPVSQQDGGGFIAAAKKMNDLMEDFLVQLQDVPDEL